MIVNAANQEKFNAYWRDRFGDLDSYESADIRNMIEAAERNFGVAVAPLQAYTLWAEHSDRYAAGWLVYSEAEWLDILREIIQ